MSFSRLVALDDGALTLKGGPFDGHEIPPHTALVSHALFLKDGRIVTGAIDGTVRVIDPSMHTWLEALDFWPELAVASTAAWHYLTPQDAGRPAAFEQGFVFALQWDGPQLAFDQAIYDSLRAANGAPSQHLSAVTDAELRELAHRNYWQPFAAGGFAEPVARILFDTALVHGRRRAIRLLQEALGGGVAADGILGPATVSQVKSADPLSLAVRLLDIRQRRNTGSPERNQRTDDRLRALAKSIGIAWPSQKAATKN